MGKLYCYFINLRKRFWRVLVTAFLRMIWIMMGLFPFFSFLRLFYCISLLSVSSFYCITFLSASSIAPFFFILFLTHQKKQANPDGAGPFSIVALSNTDVEVLDYQLAGLRTEFIRPNLPCTVF